jgi:hypothetical protein
MGRLELVVPAALALILGLLLASFIVLFAFQGLSRGHGLFNSLLLQISKG